jgi:hypothetical protein
MVTGFVEIETWLLSFSHHACGNPQTPAPSLEGDKVLHKSYDSENVWHVIIIFLQLL